MDGISCDRCGKGLLLEENTRYQVRIIVQAAYDPLEIVREDLEKDLRAEMKEALEAAKKQSPEALQDQIYREMHFDLCPPCQREFLKAPIPRVHPRRANLENPA